MTKKYVNDIICFDYFKEGEYLMLVSFMVLAYNEEKMLETLFSNLLSQDYPRNKIEVILVDSMSTDNTKMMMQDFAEQDNGFARVVVKENHKKIIPAGWNVALCEAKGDIIIRVDAHATIPSDFISKNVECIKSGEMACGGARPNIIDEHTPFKDTLLQAEMSMFGSSIAPYRRENANRYVKTVFQGAYSAEVFKKIGGYNETLLRTEDNEIHYRIRQNGFKICYNPNIISYQHTRSSLLKMLKQKYQNGYWIGLTSGVCPGCLSLYHFVPFAFILGIIFTTILAFLGFPQLSILMWSMYWILAFAMAVMAIVKDGFKITHILLPFLFFLLHVSYGVGTLVGLIKMPFWRRKQRLADNGIERVKQLLNKNNEKEA